MSQILPAMDFRDCEQVPKTRGTVWDMQRVWLFGLLGDGAMGSDADWSALLTDYEGALARFDAATRALTAALMRPGGPNGETRDLLAAETNARDVVVLTRMRLMKAWREADATLPDFNRSTDKHV